MTGATARAAQAERTRRVVLDTARALFAERGYAGASLQDIADAAGIGKANVYYYFRTKAALLDALLDERIAALEAALATAERVDGARERRELLIDSFVDQVLIAHRTLGSIDFADPSIRSQPGIGARLGRLTDRSAALLFGPTPTPDEIAGLTLALDLKPVLRRLTTLPDDDLRGVLRRLCVRLMQT
ncbi:TetR/AcrR family transcriptional regulator [Propionicimonas sp.]|uniref:TetR/AcrR family transcriptional regulator n=1 Tax=Propionicimonas sp. TaxID=1955623 RepID=UPI0039E2E206